MTERDNIKSKLVHQLGREFSEVRLDSSEYAVHATFSGTVEGKPITVEITRYPRGENPETYGGEDRWSVRVLGDEGREVRRVTNPEPSLGDAFSDVDWNRVRYDL